MLASKCFVSAVLLCVSEVIAAPVALAHTAVELRQVPDVPPPNAPSAHIKVSTYSLWDKRSNSLESRDEVPEVDLGEVLGNIHHGVSQVKTTSTSLWDSIFGWWGKRSVDIDVRRPAIKARQDELPSDDDIRIADLDNISFGIARVKNTSGSLWDSIINWWGKRDVNVNVRRQEDDGPALNEEELAAYLAAHPIDPSDWNQGSAQVKSKSFSLWDPWSWWAKRSVDVQKRAIQSRQEEEPEAFPHPDPSKWGSGSAQVKQSTYSLWNPWTWWN
ncbi:hypothetical protein N0V90_003454 [Kalmusia sp. IMI 367209]|nr:hypothetical protein N0V90_003454 [Kalmusia sp. IMI 367209]